MNDYSNKLRDLMRQQQMQQLKTNTGIWNGYPQMGSTSVFPPAPYTAYPTPLTLEERVSDLNATLELLKRQLAERDRYLAELVKHIPDALTLEEFRNYEAVAKRFQTPDPEMK